MNIKQTLVKNITWMAALCGVLVGVESALARPAPSFSLTDTQGKAHSLSDYAGKFVVLEWINHDCPFVKKHYNSDNMQSLQRKYTGLNVIWFSINSSAPGKQGNYPVDKWNSMVEAKKAAPTALLLDPEGTVGQAYGAKTTPHMFVINPEGEIIYEGAIDDKAGYADDEIAGAVNYVAAALDAAMAGQPVATPSTKSYGCSVKY